MNHACAFVLLYLLSPGLIAGQERSPLAVMSASSPAFVAWNDDTPSPVTPKPTVIFPSPSRDPITPAPEPQPQPRPAVDAVPLLTPGKWYVVQSDAEFFLLASPAKLVIIQYEQGPLRIKGLFADGEGEIETRTYSAPFLAIVDAAPAQSGRVELIAVPAGVGDEGSITRRLVDIGVAPRPPPEPEPTPNPTPDPVPVVDAFKDAVKAITAAKNPPAEERAKVATAFRSIAAEIESGSIATTEQLTHRTSDTIVEQIGLNAFLANWVPWRDDLTAALKRQSLTTVKAHAKPWATIADVLEGK